MVFDVFRQKPSAGQELDAKQSFDPAANPYKARHPWPPNFSAMSAQQRFALEKKHSRRSKMVGLRESRVKKVKIAQWTICGAVVVYFVLFHEEDNPRNHPRAEELFGGIRRWVFGSYNNVWLSQPAPRQRPDGRVVEQQGGGR